MRTNLVSVVIPCFNAEAWVAEAIESCLAQTHPHVEIIVVDDCSTDRSVEILKTYGDRIAWECLPRRSGGNVARNRGFASSKGDYVLFLDADDYILPEKLERQVAFLEETGHDAVYGDWQARFHELDGTTRLSEVVKSGPQADLLEALLADWWTAVVSLLYRRSAVERVGGWDETLPVAQDRDFFLSVVLSGATVGYLPGCVGVYRRYGNATVSTSSKSRWIESHARVVRKAGDALARQNRLTPAYRRAMAKSYFKLARAGLRLGYALYDRMLREALAIDPTFQPADERAVYQFLTRILGFRRTERLTARGWRAWVRLEARLKPGAPQPNAAQPNAA